MRTRYILALVVITLASIDCFGQGVISPRRPQPSAVGPGPQQRVEDVLNRPLPASLPVSAIRINLRVQGQVATVRVEHLFRNETEDLLEGTYYFPVPEGASLIEFAVYDGDERRVGRVKEKGEARAAYAAAAAQGEDPAILEMTRRGWFQSHVYPIPPHADKRIEIIYSQVLQAKDGVVSFDYPLGQGYKKLKVPVGSVEIDVDLRSAIAIKNVFSPTHPIDLSFDGDGHVTGKVSTVGGGEAENFQLVYSLSDSEVGMSLLTHRKEGEDGYFLLMLSPKADFDARRISAKDVIFVIDISGSMQGEKIKQAKESLRFGLTKTLNEDDRFNIVAFESSIKTMGHDLVQATRANITRALDFVDRLKADGGTNINDALVTAMKMFERAPRPHNLVFITDGLPEAGVVDPDLIAAHVRESNTVRARLFSFGVGANVNRVLLERLAAENRGAGSFIDDQSQLGQTVSGFFSKVSKPVLSDVHIDFGPVEVDRVHPAQLPDLYTRSQIRVYGRYRNAEELRDAAVGLTGQMNGQPTRFDFDGLNFPLVAQDKEFLPKLWATERVNELLAEVRVHGERQELKHEVIELAREFDLVTPYTSMYVPTTADLARERETQRPSQPAPGDASASATNNKRLSEDVQYIKGSSQAAPPGTIVDASGAVVAGATVTIRDPNTGTTRTVTTDASGNYSVAGLPPGKYEVNVEASGFKKTVVTHVVVQSGQVTAAGVELSPAGATETVTVTGIAPALIDTTATEMSSSIELRKLAELPTLNSIDSLALLAPGTNAQRPGDESQRNSDPGQRVLPTLSINGGRARSNQFTIDGVDNNGIDGRPAISIDNRNAAYEMTVGTLPTTGGLAQGDTSIEVITRAGTNEYHGSVFDYYLNRRLGALSPLERRSGLDHSPLFRNMTYGGTIGGPIVRDHIFFFGSFQGETETARRFVDSTSSLLTPTLFGLRTLRSALPASATVSDLIARGPLARVTGGSQITRTFVRPVLGVPVEFGEVTRLVPSTARGYEGVARFDFNLNNRDTLRTSYWYDARGSRDSIGRLAAGNPGGASARGQLGALLWTRLLSARTVNEFSFGLSRSRLSLDESRDQTLGGGPSVSVGPRGLAYGSDPLVPSDSLSTLYQAGDSVTHSIGRHTLKFGGDVQRRLTRFDHLPGAAGYYSYAGFDDFVLDRYAALVVAFGDPRSRFGETLQHYFLDDSWRAFSNLTLTFGLGYQRSGQPMNGFAERLRRREANPATTMFDARLPLDARTIRKLDGDNNNFAPRVGFAYTPRVRPFGLNLFGDERTVLRGGASVSFDQTAYRHLADVAASAPNVLLAVLTPASGRATFSFPSLPSAADLRSLLGSDARRYARTEMTRDFRSPYSITWHFSVGRNVADRLGVEAGYVGSRGIGLMRMLDGSAGVHGAAGPLRVYASTGRSTYHALQMSADLKLSTDLTGGVAYTWSKLTDDVPEIAAHLAGGVGDPASFAGAASQAFAQNPRDVSRGERGLSGLDRKHVLTGHFVWKLPSPRYGSGFVGTLLDGWQVSGIAGMASGSPFTALQYYGYSNALLASIFADRFGSLRPFAGSATAPADAVAFSNAANRFFNFFSNPNGTPFVSPTGFIVATRSGFHAGSVGQARFVYNDFAVEQAARALGLGPDAFGKTFAAGRPFGDVGRNTLIGPRLANVDLALTKTTKLSERVSLEFRAEAFNFFNHPSRGKPNFLVENAGGFGFADLGEADASPRRIRLGLKLTF